MEKQRIFLPLQLYALMPEPMMKLIYLLTVFQKENGEIWYSRRNAYFAHIDEALCDQSIQTAVDIGMISLVGKEGGIFKFKISNDFLEKVQKIPLKDIPEKKAIKLSTEITFKNEKSQSPDEMSPDEMKRMIQILSARLNEEENVRKLIKKNDEVNDLPW